MSPKKVKRTFDDKWEPVDLSELADEELDPQDASVRTESTLATAWLQWMKDSAIEWRRSKVTVVDDWLDTKVQPAADRRQEGVVDVRSETQYDLYTRRRFMTPEIFANRVKRHFLVDRRRLFSSTN